jgi:hypothetical protein
MHLSLARWLPPGARVCVPVSGMWVPVHNTAVIVTILKSASLRALLCMCCCACTIVHIPLWLQHRHTHHSWERFKFCIDEPSRWYQGLLNAFCTCVLCKLAVNHWSDYMDLHSNQCYTVLRSLWASECVYSCIFVPGFVLACLLGRLHLHRSH